MVSNTNKKSKTQRFKKIERKTSIVFFWCFLATIIAVAIINTKQTLPVLIAIFFMIVLGIILSFLGLRFFFKIYHRQGWHLLLSKRLSKINKPVVWITFGLIFLAIYAYKPSFSAYRIQPLSPAIESIESIVSGWFVSPALTLTFPHIPKNLPQKQIGYYGFGLTSGYQFSPHSHHILSLQLSYHLSSKTSFITPENNLATQSLHDIDVLTQYQYMPCYYLPQWHIGISGGLGFVVGFNEGHDVSVRFYRNLATIVGINTGYSLTRQVAIEVAYLHYFTPFQSSAASHAKSAISTLNRISLGVRYVF